MRKPVYRAQNTALTTWPELWEVLQDAVGVLRHEGYKMPPVASRQKTSQEIAI